MAQKVLTLSAGGLITEINDAYQGTVTSVAAITLGTTGTDLSSTVATGTSTPVITLQVPTASAANRGVLSSADWSTFNGKYTPGTALSATSGTFSGGVGSAGTLRTTSGGSFSSGVGVEIDYNQGGANTGRILAYDRDGGARKDLIIDGLNLIFKVNAGTTTLTLASAGTAAFAGAVQSTTHKVTSAGGYISSDGSTGYTGTVTTASLVGKTLTIKDGIITGFA